VNLLRRLRSTVAHDYDNGIDAGQMYATITRRIDTVPTTPQAGTPVPEVVIDDSAGSPPPSSSAPGPTA
jgi:hypothetical protein